MPKRKLTHGSLFSGVGGFDLGFDQAGIRTLWQCEVDAKCRSVLARHWPDAIRYEDIKDVNGAEIAPVDIITFGSPCQDLSVAGKRQGMKKGSGTRSSLFFEAIRVIKEMQEATNGKYPQIAIWENVRGALTSRDGKDFKTAVDALAGIGALDVSYRLVNALRYGPPQNRVRVLVVADTRRQRAGAILAHPSRVLWNPPSSKETRQETTGDVADGVGAGGWGDTRATTWALTRNIANGPDRIHAESNQLIVGALTTRCGDTQDDQQTTQLITYAAGVSLAVPLDELNQSGRTDGTSYRVRRLTPRECERLMGWPDDHTRWTHTGEELKDGTRYRMIGNGVSAPVAQWLGESIVKTWRR